MILERVKQATDKIRSDEAVYRRDSIFFEKVQHSCPVLTGLLRAAGKNGNQLSVLDFGGSLGSSYYQCRDFLSILPTLKCHSIEDTLQHHLFYSSQSSPFAPVNWLDLISCFFVHFFHCSGFAR